MLVIIIPLVALLIGIALLFLGNILSSRPGDASEYCFGFGMVLTIIPTLILIFELIALATIHINIRGNVASYEKRYESIVYQLESGMYNNLTENGKKELYDDIERWNYDLAYRKEMQHNIWNGVFYPDVYDRFNFIDYPER